MTRRLQLNEYGRVLYFNAGVDISAATSYAIKFKKPDGTEVEEAATLGLIDVTGNNIDGTEVTYTANEYVELTIPDGLLDQTGRWCYQLLAPTATTSIPSAEGSFFVVDC